MWKYLKHQNVVRFRGVASTPLQLISDWMPGRDLTEYVGSHPSADRVGLVGVPPVVFDLTLTAITSYLTLPKAFAFSTPAT